MSTCESSLTQGRIQSEPQDTMLRVSDTVRHTETAEGGILLDVHQGQMFCLNMVGAKILELVRRGYDESRIADEISRDYGASKDVVRADVIEFIQVLEKHHVLVPAPTLALPEKA